MPHMETIVIQFQIDVTSIGIFSFERSVLIAEYEHQPSECLYQSDIHNKAEVESRFCEFHHPLGS